MDQLVLPEYGRRSLAEVLPAAMTALTGAAPESALVLPPARAVALLLVDGLGHGLLREYATDAPFLSSLADAGPLTVGFPSSTVISLASLGTGQPPGAHGIVGTSMDMGGQVLDVIRWRANEPRGADLRDRFVPEGVQPHPTVLERAYAVGIQVRVVSAAVYEGSGLTRATLRGGRYRGVYALGDLAAEIITALRAPGRHLVYGYHSDLDLLGHRHGPGSFPWRLQLRQVDTLVGMIAEALPSDALLLVTGDHGMVAVDRTVDADTDPDLRRGVAALGGDGRARHVHARRGAAADVLAAWQGVLGDDAWVVSGAQAIADGWFGPVERRVTSRVGDVVVAARGGLSVIRSAAEPVQSKFAGQHGSLSAAEQLVPLLLATR